MTDGEINLKGYSILQERKEGVETKIVELVAQSIIRRVFAVRDFDASKDNEIEFIKLGTSSITNKQWYVDMPDKTYYDWKSIPAMYAESIEEGELKLVLDKIFSSIESQNTISEIVEDKNPHAAEVFGKLLDQAFSKEKSTDLIITNFHDGNKFFWLDRSRFKFNHQREERYLSGTYDGKKILVSRVVPFGKTIILNSKEIGEFIKKRDITANLDEIKDEERPKIKETLKLSDEDLDNRVRLLIEEVVQFVVKKPKMAILIETAKEEA